MTGKRNRNKNSGTPKKKRATTRNTPPTTEKAEQRFKVEPVIENKIEGEQTGGAKKSPQYDPDFSPPRDVLEDSEKWTPDDLLLDATKAYFETLSAANGQAVEHQVIQASEPLRQEFRNMFMISKKAMEHNGKWNRRLNAAKQRNKVLKNASVALNETIAKLRNQAHSAFKECEKYCVDENAQRRAIELINIRFEELNMDNSLAEECGDLLASDDEFDTVSLASSKGATKYDKLTGENALAKFSLQEIGILSEEMKKNAKEAERLRKRSQELDKKLAAANRRLQNSRKNLGKYATVVDEICASEAWKKKHDLV